jgi:Uma2 family endonuclease
MATVPSRRPEIYYPSSDGKPMAETETHLLVMFEVIDVLRAWYADDPRAWVAGNQLLYYVEGDPRQSTSPDVMVALGIGKEPLRDTYLVWKEGQAPDLVMEITSRKTRREDVTRKFDLYRDVLKVREYFLFDPLLDYLKPRLQGYRLVKGEYVRIKEVEGRLPSEVLGLHLEGDGWRLRLYNPATQAWLQSAAEVRESLRQEEQERKKEKTARKKAETARKKAEAEIERLRRELEALRRRPKQS